MTDGADNIFLGKYAGTKTTGGDNNVFLGKYVDVKIRVTITFIWDSVWTLCNRGDDNIFLGRQAAGMAVTGCYNVVFGFSLHLLTVGSIIFS